MYSLFKILRSFVKSLNGDATPASCAGAVLFGCLIGFTPFGIHTVLLFALLLVFRVPFGLGVATGAVMKLVSLILLPLVAAPLGAWMLEEGMPTRRLVVTLLDVPVLGLVPLERHAVLGGLVLGGALGVLLWFPSVLGVKSYRASLRGRLTGARWYGKVSWLFGRPPEKDRQPGFLDIIRWKLALGVAAVLFVAGWLGAPWAVDRAISRALEETLMEEAHLGKVSVSLFSGRVTIEDLQVGGFGTDEGHPQVLAARRAHADISVSDLLRRKAVIEVLELEDPRMTLETDENGQLVILKKQKEKDREKGLDPKEILGKVEETWGRIETARDWIQKVRQVLAYLDAREEVAAGDAERLRILAGTTPLPERGPGFVVKSARISGLAIRQSSSSEPEFRNFELAGSEISSAPAWHDAAMGLFTGGLVGPGDPATLLLQTLASPESRESVRIDVQKAEVANLDATVIDDLAGATLPFLLKQGRIALRTDGGWVRGDGTCDLKVTLLVKGLRVAPRPGVTSLAGQPADRLCQAVSEAGDFGLDVRLTGNMLDPHVDLGNAPELLLQMGGKAFARLARSELEKRFGPGIGKLLEGTGPIALPGALTGATGPDAASGGLPDLLGGVLEKGGLRNADGGNPFSDMLGGKKLEDLPKGLRDLLPGKKR